MFKKKKKRKHISNPHVHCIVIYNSQDLETTQEFINGWMDKETVVYIYNGILFSHKKMNEILSFVTIGMDLEGIMLSERSQKQTNTIWSHLHTKSTKNPKLIDTENTFVCSCQRQRWGMGKMADGDQKVQTSSYKISYEDVMYSMLTIVNNVLHIWKFLRE